MSMSKRDFVALADAIQEHNKFEKDQFTEEQLDTLATFAVGKITISCAVDGWIMLQGSVGHGGCNQTEGVGHGQATHPAIFNGVQQAKEPFELWTILEPIEGHPQYSTVSRRTIEGQRTHYCAGRFWG